MIIWGIIWGVFIGSYVARYGDFGAWLGGFAGFFAGLSLRWVVRREMAANLEKSRKQILATFRQEMHSSHTASKAHAAPTAPAVHSGVLATHPTQANTPDNSITGTKVDLPESVPSKSQTEVFSKAFEQPPPQMPRTVPATDNPGAFAQEAGSKGIDNNNPKNSYKPAEPETLELVFIAVKNWFVGGNTIVRVGLVILFIGLSFLARYAASAGLIPVELRLGSIGAAAIALLAIGFRKRDAKPGLALAFQGAGVAVMYLTVFAAFRLYNLIPPLPAFALMIVVCALSCTLALLQNSRALAVAAFAGGFAVPLLLSTGSGSHVGLFSYYALLNVAILFIAYKRSWRVLNVVGFIATFGVATAWGTLSYLPEQYATTQPFLIFFVLNYLLTAVMYARNTPARLGNMVDSMLVFGTPLIGFGLQAGLVRQFEFGAAFSALGFAVLYLGVASVLARRTLENYRVLIECLLAIGVGFVTLAIPLALDARWTSAVWALEGAGAFWVGMRQARWMPRAFGLLMQGVAAAVFLNTVAGNFNVSAWPFVNPAFLGALFVTLPAFGIAIWLRKPLAHSGSTWAAAYAALEGRLGNLVYLYGFAFWCLAWSLEISRYFHRLKLECWRRVFSMNQRCNCSRCWPWLSAPDCPCK